MGYRVTWCLVGPGERAVDKERFPDTFAKYEEAVHFVLGRLAAAPRFGYDRSRSFWWLRGRDRVNTEMRFWIECNGKAAPDRVASTAA
jgi:hypothetical protein